MPFSWGKLASVNLIVYQYMALIGFIISSGYTDTPCKGYVGLGRGFEVGMDRMVASSR